MPLSVAAGRRSSSVGADPGRDGPSHWSEMVGAGVGEPPVWIDVVQLAFLHLLEMGKISPLPRGTVGIRYIDPICTTSSTVRAPSNR